MRDRVNSRASCVRASVQYPPHVLPLVVVGLARIVPCRPRAEHTAAGGVAVAQPHVRHPPLFHRAVAFAARTPAPTPVRLHARARLRVRIRDRSPTTHVPSTLAPAPRAHARVAMHEVPRPLPTASYRRPFTAVTARGRMWCADAQSRAHLVVRMRRTPAFHNAPLRASGTCDRALCAGLRGGTALLRRAPRMRRLHRARPTLFSSRSCGARPSVAMRVCRARYRTHTAPLPTRVNVRAHSHLSEPHPWYVTSHTVGVCVARAYVSARAHCALAHLLFGLAHTRGKARAHTRSVSFARSISYTRRSNCARDPHNRRSKRSGAVASVLGS